MQTLKRIAGNTKRRSCLFTYDPELAITLACARIGAIHSVVLQDFQLRQYFKNNERM
jgi:acyl-coenzyme A synthetase/AMP-(fatty) acid ligase